MRNIKPFHKDGGYGVMDDGIEAVPPVHATRVAAVSEWVAFETLNTNAEPHRRFLSHVTLITEIKTIASKYAVQLT